MKERPSRSHINAVIGAALRLARQRSGISQTKAGKLVNLSPQQMTKYEAGLNAVPPDVLFLMARHLGINLEELASRALEGLPVQSSPMRVSNQLAGLFEDIVQLKPEHRYLMFELARQLKGVERTHA